MTLKLDIERAVFDLDVFQQILKAMDGYAVLPSWRIYEEDPTNGSDILPWELPDMPDVSIDVWQYHVGLAVDRGFVQCKTPRQTQRTNYHQSMQRGQSTLRSSTTTTRHVVDPNVSSQLMPARLTWAGKEFVDSLNDSSIKEQAREAMEKWGPTIAIQMAVEAAKTIISSVG